MQWAGLPSGEAGGEEKTKLLAGAAPLAKAGRVQHRLCDRLSSARTSFCPGRLLGEVAGLTASQWAKPGIGETIGAASGPRARMILQEGTGF